MAKWLLKIDGEVAAPGNGTCKSVHGGRTIDFFIVDIRITQGVLGVWVQFDVPSSPHYVVVLRLLASAPRDEYVKVITPKSFDAIPAKGWQRKEVYEPSCLRMVSDMADASTVDEAFRCMTEKSEKQLCGVFDCVLQDSSHDWEYLGRGGCVER